jgi:single-strand DNA-binding protein
VNVVILIGNLATEVDVRDLGEGRTRGYFVLAVDRRSANGGADFVEVTVWDRQAEVCAQFLSKGKRVGIDGRLRSSSWEDAEGKKRRALEVVAQSVEFLSPPDGAGGDDTPFADVVPLAERSMA